MSLRDPLSLWPLSNIAGVFRLKSKIAAKEQLKLTEMPKTSPLITGPLDALDRILG
jgi:hypothetical protein